MSECTHGNLFSGRLKEYEDGECSVIARLQIARHLRRCNACSKELQEMSMLT